MKALTAILLLLFSFCALTAQPDKSIWDKRKYFENPFCKFKAPTAWENKEIEEMGQMLVIDASGKGLPVFFNGAPIRMFIILRNLNANSLDAALDSAIAGLTKNPLWFWPKGLKYEKQDYKLKSGQKAYLLTSRNYWQRQNLHQSQYELISYSASQKTAMALTIRVQHYDPKYEIEDRIDIANYPVELFGSFELK
jgi:hypothetical protein